MIFLIFNHIRLADILHIDNNKILHGLLISYYYMSVGLKIGLHKSFAIFSIEINSFTSTYQLEFFVRSKNS